MHLLQFTAHPILHQYHSVGVVSAVTHKFIVVVGDGLDDRLVCRLGVGGVDVVHGVRVQVLDEPIIHSSVAIMGERRGRTIRKNGLPRRSTRCQIQLLGT